MLGAAAFQTQLARRQVDLDRVDRQIRAARQRLQRPSQSTCRVALAGAPGGQRGGAREWRTATKTDFINIDPEVVAEVQQSAGGVFDPGAESQDPVFDEFKIVKSVAGG